MIFHHKPLILRFRLWKAQNIRNSGSMPWTIHWCLGLMLISITWQLDSWPTAVIDWFRGEYLDVGYWTTIMKYQGVLGKTCLERVWLIQFHHFKMDLPFGGFRTWGTLKSSILRGFSLISYPFWGTPNWGNPHKWEYHNNFPYKSPNNHHKSHSSNIKLYGYY